MERITGIGGVFFKSQDPAALQTWYREHLGIEPASDGYQVFLWHERENADAPGSTVWAPFPADTDYFGPTKTPFMFNYRVRDLDAMLAQLRAASVMVDDRLEVMEGVGRLGWATDLDGNRFELWEPAPGQ